MHMFSFKSSHRRYSVKEGGLKNFAHFTGKHLCWSLFLIKLPLACIFIKKRLQHSCFPVKFEKFLRTPILKIICERTASVVSFSCGSMFIIYVIDLSTKNKMQRRGFIFLQKSKIQTVGDTQKNFFQLIYFGKS